MKRIQILFKKNEYYELSKFEITNQNSEIDYLFLNPNNYYVYQFKKTSDEIPITLHFSKEKDSFLYTKIELSYKAFYSEMEIINNNFYQCINSEKMYAIQPSTSKPIIEIIYDWNYNVEFNGMKKNKQVFISTQSENYLNIVGEESHSVCFAVNYFDKDTIDLKKNEEFKLKIMMKQKYTFRISDIKENHNVTLFIKQEGNNLEYPIIKISDSEGKFKVDKNNEGIYNTTIIPFGKELLLDIVFNVDSSKEEIVIYYNLVRNKPRISKGFLNFVHNFTYFVIALFGLSLIWSFCCEKDYQRKNQNNYKLTYSRIKERLLSVYACKKD